MCSVECFKKKGSKYAHNTRDINMRLNSISLYTTTTHQNPNEKRKTKPRTKIVKSTRYVFHVSLVKWRRNLKKKKNAANRGFVFLVLVERNFFMNLPVMFVPYSKVPASFWPKDLRDASWWGPKQAWIWSVHTRARVDHLRSKNVMVFNGLCDINHATNPRI